MAVDQDTAVEPSSSSSAAENEGTAAGTISPSQQEPQQAKTDDRYLVLVEFVYRHLNFQMAELRSILETHGIDLGSDDECCRILPLPVPPIATSSASAEIRQENRAFVILSFPIATAPRWSGLLQPPEVQRRNSRFEPRIDGRLLASTLSSLSIADILYKCTLVKSVIELWGYSSTNLKDCAQNTFDWLHRKSNNNSNNDTGNADHNDSLPSSFQKDHVWPSICDDDEKPWKFTIHTLGMKVRHQEQDEMRQTFRKTLDCIRGPVRMKDPNTQEFLLIREIELDGKGSPLWRTQQPKQQPLVPATTTTTTTTTTASSGSDDSGSNDNDNKNNNDSDKNNNETTNTNGKDVANAAAAAATTPATSTKAQRSYCDDAIAYYFGRVLGGRTRSSDGSRGIDHYLLKSRPYLGPTSMDAELSFVMTSLGKVTTRSMVYDPFVGTGSILLSCAMRGAYCVGSDIDIRVLRGKGGDQTIWKNFDHYGLPRPEIVRTDNALYHRHYRHHHHPSSKASPMGGTVATPLYDAILCDPPYGIRAGARKTGSKLDQPRQILEENRHTHIPQTKPYVVSDVMSDLLDVAARTLVLGGRLVYVIPSFRDFDDDRDLPRHDCLELIHVCYQPFSNELGRRIVAMKKITDYDESKRPDYLVSIWKYGAESADKCANLRDKIMEAARQKPGYEEKAAIRKEKRKANKEAKKKEKRAKRLLLAEQGEKQTQEQKHTQQNGEEQPTVTATAAAAVI